MGKKDTARSRAADRKAKKLSRADRFRAGKKGYGLPSGKWKRRRGVWVFFKD